MQPYDPQRPATPDSFGGRKALLAAAHDSTEVARVVHRGSAMLLYGYRGSGKTSALRKIQSLVREMVPKAVILEIPLRVPSSESMLVNGIAEMIHRQVDPNAKLASRVKRSLDTLTAVNILGSGVERIPPTPTSASTLLTVWNDALRAMAERPLLVICLDDAELLKAGEAGILKTMIETDSPVPIVMIVAGGPELMEKFSRRETSPILRAFSGNVFDLGQFTFTETREVLDAPLRHIKGAGSWSDPAVRFIHQLTHGYPYLVLCFATASYVEGRSIREADVRQSIRGALKLASPWLERELPDASDEDIRAFGKIATLNSQSFRSSEVLKLGINPLYLSRLTELGVLKRVARGRYELLKAPAIAYFHAIERGLDLIGTV
jgi:AAA ATPase domain